jgi:putative ABC transport system ATP-binding protein
VVEIRGVMKSYPLAAETVQALRGVSLVLRAGELVALVGASGSGKTTLLNLLGCLDRPTEGVILLQGQEVQDLGERRLAEVRRKQVGFVFQDAALIPTITALENVGLPFSFDRWTGERNGIPAQMLALVGMADKGSRYPEELSGGERQRVAIARALVHRPSLLLADEPTGNLDSENGRRIFALFRELVQEHRLCALVATHNEELAGLADRRIHLRDGQLVDGADR